MEVFMKNLSYYTTEDQVIVELVEILRREEYRQSWGIFPVNLDVDLHQEYKKPGMAHSGSGTFTVAVESVGRRFLQEYGGYQPTETVQWDGRPIFFEESRYEPIQAIINRLERTPFVDPQAEAEKQRKIAQAEANHVLFRGIEFGWECRDAPAFSCEWEKYIDPLGSLNYDVDRRELRADFWPKSITLRLGQIRWASCGMDDDDLPVICFGLESAPIFEEDISDLPSPFRRTRISSIDSAHRRLVAYTSLAVRFICKSRGSLKRFRVLWKMASLNPLSSEIFRKEYRQLFSVEREWQLREWLARLNFEVAFQMEMIVRDSLADFREILTMRRAVEKLIRLKGTVHTVGVLRSFHSTLKISTQGIRPVDILPLFITTVKEYTPETDSPTDQAFKDTFSCYHVIVTPTAMRLSGPFRERSNRIFRRYPDYNSCFIRVSFEEETRLHLRFDRDVDGAAFVDRRYGTILHRTGLEIGGRKHNFLAYSQSALKEHSVWFMRPFFTQAGELVDSTSIITSLGDFDNTLDPILTRCPGRYGARISQSFTSTTTGISIQPEEIHIGPDITVPKVRGDPSSGEWNFTDGVGTISPELAKDICDAIGTKSHFPPKCFQIRFQGCKGMVSVDYRQSGRALFIRNSMMKYKAPEWLEIEIVQAFDRPSPFYLNRPLIMVLEGLGMEYKVFKKYQDKAVQGVQCSRKTFKQAGKFFESFGLGASFQIPSIMYHLHKLGVPMQGGPFYTYIMDFAINHALRELKHNSRIPVPGYTLVGVADVHGWLQPNQVFACVANSQAKELEYLEGTMVITRSPVIHPGDVQIVHAIGLPPPGSPFEKEPLPNAVVFSTKGNRPVPSMLGGGDLDGDIYNIASLKHLPIKRLYRPATYNDAQKTILEWKCTMSDVADFVVDYINSDVLGLVSINWRIIADQSEKFIFDEDCMTLAQLHSDAVDYPKSSTPVPLDKIPRPKSNRKPDWHQPETMNDNKSADYYESFRVIGHLFRAITLPALDIVQKVNLAQRKKLRAKGEGEGEERLLAQFERMSLREDDQIDVAVHGRITQFIDGNVDLAYRAGALTLFDRYTTDLKGVCAAHTLSYRRDAMLTEEEVVVGTIVAKTSQPRFRKDLMSKVREQTSLQVKYIRDELASEEGFKARLNKAWALWRVTQEERDFMGARSLGLIALGAIFDTINEIEEERGRG